MKKIIVILIAVLFLLPSISVADSRRDRKEQRERSRYSEKYRVHQNKHVRAHKEDRHAPEHRDYRRGHIYRYDHHYPGHPFNYRRHYTWREWYGGARYSHPQGRYHREGSQMMFSYCESPGLCFSFSIGD